MPPIQLGSALVDQMRTAASFLNNVLAIYYDTRKKVGLCVSQCNLEFGVEFWIWKQPQQLAAAATRRFSITLLWVAKPHGEIESYNVHSCINHPLHDLLRLEASPVVQTILVLRLGSFVLFLLRLTLSYPKRLSHFRYIAGVENCKIFREESRQLHIT
jgi:hypothetical protein